MKIQGIDRLQNLQTQVKPAAAADPTAQSTNELLHISLFSTRATKAAVSASDHIKVVYHCV